jgi:flavin-dependent dehydrogenase
VSGAYDAVVLGAGPAGAQAAATLAETGHRVLLLEAGYYDQPRIGETLPPSAIALLRRLGRSRIADEVLLSPALTQMSVWGDDELRSRSFLFNPFGYGAHLDRCAFDRSLARAAVDLGADIRHGTRLVACTAAPGHQWRLTVRDRDDHHSTLVARAVIDATGRQARLARLLGARRRSHDRLVAVAFRYQAVEPVHHTLVEAAPTGWWYSAPQPPDAAVAVFLTDADLCRRHDNSRVEHWERELGRTSHVRRRFRHGERMDVPRIHPACSHHLDHGGAPGRWLAVGDAALAVDPLSSSGIEWALTSGHVGGLAIAHWLNGHREPAQDYRAWIAHVYRRYWQERTEWYRVENRWPDSPFWRRRHVATAPVG